jgi:hypothetical protein
MRRFKLPILGSNRTLLIQSRLSASRRHDLEEGIEGLLAALSTQPYLPTAPLQSHASQRHTADSTAGKPIAKVTDGKPEELLVDFEGPIIFKRASP